MGELNSSFIPHPSSFNGEAWIVTNPIAGGRGGRRRLDEAIRFLKSRLPVSEERWTQRRGDAEQWAREAVAQNVALVVGAGGDGTVNELANGLAGSDVSLGILPIGTTNVIALELQIPLDLLEAAKCLLGGKAERIHVGRAEYQPFATETPQTQIQNPQSAIQNPESAIGNPQLAIRANRCFLFSAGLGFDAYACHRVNLELKQWTPKTAYVFEGFRLFLRYQSPRLSVSLDGAEPIACSELIVCKARAYAGQFWVAPEASLRRPDLEACLFLRAGRWNLFRYVWGILRGKHAAYPDVLCRTVQSVEVTSDGLVYLHLDGDTLGTAPVRFSVERNALSVVVPPD